jgi:pimeloyl-ACP methyl ester carboxylesterase
MWVGTENQRLAMSAVIHEGTAVVQGRTIFYLEAGDRFAPTLLLLHGLPGSSAEYRQLIAALADKFHLVAPDYLGFGGSEAPAREAVDYTFETLTAHVAGLVEVLGLKRYLLYMHDCGGPVGFRLFSRDPGRVTGFIIQNANAYAEGVSTACFRAFAPLWENRSPETEQAAEDFVSLLDPTASPRPQLSTRRGAGKRPSKRLQPPVGLVDLLEDYRTNVALYPDWQAAFRTHMPPTLIIWGKHDPVFIPPGARAYLDDLPRAKLVWLDAGHSVLEQNWSQVAAEIKAAFLSQTVAPPLAAIARERAARMYPALSAL